MAGVYSSPGQGFVWGLPFREGVKGSRVEWHGRIAVIVGVYLSPGQGFVWVLPFREDGEGSNVACRPWGGMARSSWDWLHAVCGHWWLDSSGVCSSIAGEVRARAAAAGRQVEREAHADVHPGFTCPFRCVCALEQGDLWVGEWRGGVAVWSCVCRSDTFRCAYQ